MEAIETVKAINAEVLNEFGTIQHQGHNLRRVPKRPGQQFEPP
jgi:hypothetical protein